MTKERKERAENAADRETRLAARLRDNLKRRKEQARAREKGETQDGGAPDADAPKRT